MCHRTRSLSAWGLAALCLLASPPSSARAASAPEVTLTRSRVSILEDGQIVASFDAGGDVRGMLTVDIDRDAKGALTGEWFLVNRYVRDVNADGEVDDRMAAERAALPGVELHGLHREYIEMCDGGTLRGSITGGSLDFDVDGTLRGIQSLTLAIDDGNLTFSGMKGAGSLTASNLRDENGTGTLRLAPASASKEGAR